MNVLLLGGSRTENTVKVLEKNLRSSGVNMMTANYLSDVQEIYNRGDNFDKLIVMEQAWTYNGQYSLDSNCYGQETVRDQLIEFIQDLASRYCNGQQFVFIVASSDQAELIQSETVHMIGYQAVVNMPKPITAQFMVQLILKDINSYDSEILYKPMDIAGQEEDMVESGQNQIGQQQEVQEDADTDINWEDNGVNWKDNGVNWENSGVNWEDNGVNWENSEIQFTPDTGYEFNGEELVADDNSFDESDYKVNNGSDDKEFNTEEYSDNQNENKNNSLSETTQGTEQDSLYDDINNGYCDLNTNQMVEIPNEQYTFNAEEFKSNPFDDTQIDTQQQITDYDPFSNQPDPYNNQPDPYNNQPDPYNNQPDPYNNQPDPYNNQPDPYNNQPQNPYEQQEYSEYQGNPYDDSEPDLRDNIDQNARNLANISTDDAAKLFAAFANRGNSIMVTGAPGAGTSTVAFQLANLLRLMNYTVLLVDFDIKGRSQTYMCQANYNATDHDENRLVSAVNSTSGMNQYIAIASQNLHLLNLGLDIDDKPIDQMLQKNRIMKFANQAKNGHNFVIYDVPFDFAAGHLEDITTMADNIVIVADSSTWGAMKTLLYMMNVEDEAVLETLFGKAQILFNRYRNFPKILNEKIRKPEDILKAMDKQLQEMVGADIGYQFRSIHTCGVIPFMTQLEEGWLGKEKSQWTATKEGQAIFVDILKKIVFRDQN